MSNKEYPISKCGTALSGEALSEAWPRRGQLPAKPGADCKNIPNGRIPYLEIGHWTLDIDFSDPMHFVLSWLLLSVRSQMVDFGSKQGLSDFETGGIAGYVEDFKRAKTQLGAKRCRLWADTT
jgi:hypothetical protein